MSNFLILGDIHIGKGLSIGKPASGSTLNSRLQDQINILNWVVEQALEHDVGNIFVTGDVFEDPRPHPEIITHFVSWLKKCETNNIMVHIIAGNHDIMRSGSYTISALDIIPAVEFEYAKVYKDVKTINFDDISFTLLPYRDRRMYDLPYEEAINALYKEFSPEINKIPENNKKLVIGHLAFKGSLPVGDEIDDLNNELFCPLEMFIEWDYVWMGHIHKPQRITYDETFLYHIGSMDKSSFDSSETDINKHIVILKKDNKYRPENIQIPSRPLLKVSVNIPSDQDSTDYLLDHLRSFNKDKPLKNAIIKLSIELEGPDIENVNRNRLREFLYQDLEAHHICEIREIRNIAVIKNEDAQVLFDNKMDAKATVTTYFDSGNMSFESDEQKSLAISFAHECVQEYENKQKDKK